MPTPATPKSLGYVEEVLLYWGPEIAISSGSEPERELMGQVSYPSVWGDVQAKNLMTLSMAVAQHILWQIKHIKTDLDAGMKVRRIHALALAQYGEAIREAGIALAEALDRIEDERGL